ncbi:MAG: metal-sensitive transcriptional regulator, partial [Aggregatilineales bacterium]
MADSQTQKTETGHTDRHAHNKKSLDRIRRMKGQLAALERMIEADDGTCEDRVIRARTVEKGMNSLITHLVSCYLENTARPNIETDPDDTLDEMGSDSKTLQYLYEAPDPEVPYFMIAGNTEDLRIQL